jgi:nucleotide-binding universal stress UspA family protein
VILYTADYVGADLIAVGASGHSAIAKFFLGSVAESVARHSRHPVLVTRPLTAPLREVIVGVDGSDSAAAAAAFTVSRFPLPLICTLRLASVVPQPVFSAVTNPLYPGMPDYLALEMVNEEARKKVGLDVEALADTLRRAKGGCRIEGEPVTLGSPAAELVRIADEHSAGLIVVGSQGLSGITRFLLGSVSERVLRHAHCSVLIVK